MIRRSHKIFIFGFILCVTIIILFNQNQEADRISSERKKLNDELNEKVIQNMLSVKQPINVFGNNVKVGEMGEAVILPDNYSDEIQRLVHDGWGKHEFNQYVSDLISVNRSLPENGHAISPADCFIIHKPHLSKTSVIITFHNEAWSTLLRTVHSVLNRGGDHVLEVILVDDFSDMDHLKEPLNRYMMNFPKVVIHRAKKRVGLIKARIMGAQVAIAPVLTFLDSHVECADKWLEPLLNRLYESPKSVVVPVIDTIDENTFEYQWIKGFDAIPIGGFNWQMSFKWIVNSETSYRGSQPIITPTMSGGLFAINKDFFYQLGMYDPELEIWGGENLELSFKTWMCGGSVEIIPCSHVGHVFRSKSPYNKDSVGRNVIKRNLIRVAQVWMDDYAKFFLMRIHAREGDFSDVSSRKMYRQECKNFTWYLESVYPSQFDPSKAIAQGKLRSIILDTMCVEMSDDSVKLGNCRSKAKQFIVLSDVGELRRDDYCLSGHRSSSSSGLIKFDYCMQLESQQMWTFNNITRQLFYTHTHKCLSIDTENNLTLDNCSELTVEQKWTFEYMKNVQY